MHYFQYLDQFLLIAAAHIFAVISPGPDFFLIVRQSFLYGRKKTILTSLGIASGILIHTSYCTLGLSFILSHEFIYATLRILCAVYLFYLGFKSLLSKPNKNVFDTQTIRDNNPTASISSFSAYKQGFITNAFNVKAGLFFISLYSFIDSQTPNYLLFFYGLWMTFITGVWFILLTFLLTSKSMNRMTYHYHTYINKFMGILLMYIAIKIYLNY